MSVFALFFVLGIQGCASAKKKQCESENWSRYGDGVAQQGQPWESQAYLDECRKEGIQPDLNAIQQGYVQGQKSYCSREPFFQAGKQGDARSSAICPADQRAALEKEYQRGVQGHCTKQGAFLRGKSGKPKTNVCPAALAASYDHFFNQGRIAFLKSDLGQKEKRVFEIERRQTALELEITQAERKRARYQYLKEKTNPTTTETIEFLAADNPESLITAKIDERSKLPQERESLLTMIQALKAEISFLESQTTSVPTGELDAHE